MTQRPGTFLLSCSRRDKRTPNPAARKSRPKLPFTTKRLIGSTTRRSIGFEKNISNLLVTAPAATIRHRAMRFSQRGQSKTPGARRIDVRSRRCGWTPVVGAGLDATNLSPSGKATDDTPKTQRGQTNPLPLSAGERKKTPVKQTRKPKENNEAQSILIPTS